MQISLINLKPVNRSVIWLYHVDSKYTVELYRSHYYANDPATDTLICIDARPGLIGMLHHGLLSAKDVCDHQAFALLGEFDDGIEPNSREAKDLIAQRITKAIAK